MLHEELVERVVLGDEHGERPLRTPAGATRLLPHRGAGARVAGEDRRVERTDVDPELERVRRRDREQVAVGELSFETTTVLGEVPGAVGLDARPRLGRSPTPRRVNSARSSAARRDRVNPIVRTPWSTSFAISHDASDSAERRWPVSSSTIGGFHRTKRFSPRGDGVLDDRVDLEAGQAGGELCRVPDGRAREAPARVAAVVRDEAPEPPKDHRDVRAEHTAEHMRLVDDDELEPVKEIGPAP